MNKTTVLIATFVALAGFMAACGVPCDMLEDKLCDELGEEDCKAWKASGAPAQLRSSRRSAKGCFNALAGPTFDAYLQGAKAVAEAQGHVDGS